MCTFHRMYNPTHPHGFDEIHLLICLGSAVFPSVPKSELVSDLYLTFVIMFTVFIDLWEWWVRRCVHGNSAFGGAVYCHESLVMVADSQTFLDLIRGLLSKGSDSTGDSKDSSIAEPSCGDSGSSFPAKRCRLR